MDDDRPDEEVDEPPPIGFSGQELVSELAKVLVVLRSEQQELTDERIMIFIAAAIEANNHKLYEDLRALGVISDPDEGDDDSDAGDGP
jgi:hypothetical protein